MNHSPLFKKLRQVLRWLRLKSRSIWAARFAGDRYLFWQRLVADLPNEFESYGVYDPHVLTVLASLAAFKPLEYCLDGLFDRKSKVQNS